MSSASKQFQDRNPSLTGKVSNNSQRNEHDHNNNHDIIRSQHGEEAKNTEAYNKVSTIRRKKEPLDLSNRPPWVGIGTPIKKKDRPAPPGDRMKQINVVISSIDDTTGPSDKNRVSMEEITERLHKGIRAKVKIRKPKIPKFLQVHTAPIIVPEIKAKIKESYKRFISASQSSLPCNSDSDQTFGSPSSCDHFLCDEVYRNPYAAKHVSSRFDHEHFAPHRRSEFGKPSENFYQEFVPQRRSEFRQSSGHFDGAYVPQRRTEFRESSQNFDRDYVPRRRSEFGKPSEHFDRNFVPQSKSEFRESEHFNREFVPSRRSEFRQSSEHFNREFVPSRRSEFRQSSEHFNREFVPSRRSEFGQSSGQSSGHFNRDFIPYTRSGLRESSRQFVRDFAPPARRPEFRESSENFNRDYDLHRGSEFGKPSENFGQEFVPQRRSEFRQSGNFNRDFVPQRRSQARQSSKNVDQKRESRCCSRDFPPPVQHSEWHPESHRPVRHHHHRHNCDCECHRRDFADDEYAYK